MWTACTRRIQTNRRRRCCCTSFLTTRRTRWRVLERKCCTRACCRWLRRMEWWCGCGIRSGRSFAERKSGPRRKNQAGEVRREQPGGGEWRKANERKALREEISRGRAGRDGNGRPTAGAIAVGASVVRVDGSGGFGAVRGKDVRGGDAVARRGADSRSGTRIGGERTRAGARMRLCFFGAGFFGGGNGGGGVCQSGLSGGEQFAESPDGCGCAAADSGGKRRASGRNSNAAEEPRVLERIYRDESELLDGRTGAGAEAAGGGVWAGENFCGDDASGFRGGISGSGFAGHSGKRGAVHQRRRRKDGSGAAEAAGQMGRRAARPSGAGNQRALQSRAGAGRALGVRVAELEKDRELEGSAGSAAGVYRGSGTRAVADGAEESRGGDGGRKPSAAEARRECGARHGRSRGPRAGMSAAGREADAAFA